MADPVRSAGGEPPAPQPSPTPVAPPATEVVEVPQAGASGRGPAARTSAPDAGSKRLSDRGRRGPLAFLSELPILLAVAFILALLIKTFLVQAFYIPSESMEPTLNVGDRVLVNKVVYHLHPPRRGDVIVFSDPHPAPPPHRSAVSAFVHWLTEGLGVSTSPDKDFIKRVVGLPGETLEVHRGVVFIDGKALREPFLTPAARQIGDFNPVHIPANMLFVMGDNRGNSNDSRFQLGFIPYDKVIGRAFVTIWPPSRVGWLHGF